MRDRVLIIHVMRERTPNRESMDGWLLEQVCDALFEGGADPRPVAFFPGEMAGVSRKEGRCAVLNMAYGYRSPDGSVHVGQPDVSREIEDAGFFPVGSNSRTQGLVQDKKLCGEWLRRRGFRVPRDYDSPARLEAGDGALVVKPRFGSAHRDVRIVEARALFESAWPDPAFMVQEYIHPPEYTVAVIETARGPEALPPLHIGPPPGFDDERWVMTGSADWAIEAREDSDRYDLRGLSTLLFARFGMRDLARFDFRIADGAPAVLDVNSLPNLHPTRSYLPLAAAAGGISYAEMVQQICARARAEASAAER